MTRDVFYLLGVAMVIGGCYLLCPPVALIVTGSGTLTFLVYTAGNQEVEVGDKVKRS